RWGRFHLARGASLLLCVGLFPLMAPRTGSPLAHWTLLVVGGVVNFCSDKYWSFSPDPSGRRRRAAGRTVTSRRLRRLVLAGALAAAVAVAVAFTDAFIFVVSVFMIVVATTTLTFQLYKWWRPEHNDPHRYGEPDAPRLAGGS